MASVGNVDSGNSRSVNDNAEQKTAVDLIRTVTDPTTGNVDTRQLAADVTSAKDFHTASQTYEQIETELSRQNPMDAAQFSRDVADEFEQGKAIEIPVSDTGNQNTPRGLAQLLKGRGIRAGNVPTPAATQAARPESGAPLPASTPRIQNLSPFSLKFSQKDVKATTDDGMPLQELANNMRAQGWKGKPLDAVQWSDGSFTSVDNRRPFAARKAELATVPVRVHGENDPVPASQADRFKLGVNVRRLDNGDLVVGGNKGQIEYAKGAKPSTWGEAAMFRAANQGNVKGSGRFPLRGSYDQPAVRQPKAQSGAGAPADDQPPPSRSGGAETTSARTTPPAASPDKETAVGKTHSASDSRATQNVNERTPAGQDSRSFGPKAGTVTGAAVGAAVTAVQLAVYGKLNIQSAGEVAKGAGEGAAIGAVATKGEQLLTPVIDRAIGGAVQNGATQLAAKVTSQGAAETAGVAARTLATRVAGGTAVGAVITAGISAWDNREGLEHGDSHAIGNVVADTTVGAGSIAAATVAGAAVGSVVPVAGTAVGAAVGLAVGLGITYGAQISGVRDDIANGVADGVDAAKDAAKSVGHDIGNVASKVSHFFDF